MKSHKRPKQPEQKAQKDCSRFADTTQATQNTVSAERAPKRGHRRSRARRSGDHMTHTDSNETQHPREGCGRRGRGGPKAGYGPRGQHRAKRALKHGDLKFFIIALLKDAPRHGYDMMTEIEALSKGAYKPSPGVMYPALNLIQDMGWATTEDQNGKKTYSITGEGVAALAENEERITAIYERLERLSQPKETGEARPLRMALDGLRHDVKSYMRQNRGDEVKREKLAKIIAKARAEIAELTEVKNT